MNINHGVRNSIYRTGRAAALRPRLTVGKIIAFVEELAEICEDSSSRAVVSLRISSYIRMRDSFFMAWARERGK
jgi:hypothetical protein